MTVLHEQYIKSMLSMNLPKYFEWKLHKKNTSERSNKIGFSSSNRQQNSHMAIFSNFFLRNDTVVFKIDIQRKNSQKKVKMGI